MSIKIYHNILWPGSFHDSALLHFEDPVGDAFNLLHIVGGHDHQGSGFFFQFQDYFLDNRGVLRIDGSGGLIQEQDFRFQHQGPGQAEALGFPAGKGQGSSKFPLSVSRAMVVVMTRV